MFKVRAPFFNQDGPGGGGNEPPQTVTIGDKEYSIADLQNKLTGYEKLEKQFTKVSQENSDLRKTAESAKEWLNFEQTIQQLPPNMQQQFIKQTNEFFAAVQSGNVTQQDVSGINKAIKAAEKSGETGAAEALEGARDDALQTIWLNEQYDELEERAESDGIQFKKKEFEKFLTKYLEDEGYDETDDVTKREIRAAYKLYAAEKKEKSAEDERKRNLPNLGTGASGVAAGGKPNDKGPKNVKEATKLLLGGWGR
jgi:hypothetical protein